MSKKKNKKTNEKVGEATEGFPTPEDEELLDFNDTDEIISKNSYIKDPSTHDELFDCSDADEIISKRTPFYEFRAGSKAKVIYNPKEENVLIESANGIFRTSNSEVIKVLTDLDYERIL